MALEALEYDSPLHREARYRRQRRAVWLGLSLAILMVTGSQACWKAATQSIPQSADAWQVLSTTVRQPLFGLAMCLYVLQFFNWMWVLSNADLSYAQPITALSYVSVSILAKLWFGEQLPTQRLLGIGLILAGVWFISRTKHRTPEAVREPTPVAVQSECAA